jgi:hypothetical protein
MKKRTFHAGASLDRQSVLRKLRRDRLVVQRVSGDVLVYIGTLIEWVRQRPARYRRRPGGL